MAKLIHAPSRLTLIWSHVSGHVLNTHLIFTLLLSQVCSLPTPEGNIQLFSCYSKCSTVQLVASFVCGLLYKAWQGLYISSDRFVCFFIQIPISFFIVTADSLSGGHTIIFYFSDRNTSIHIHKIYTHLTLTLRLTMQFYFTWMLMAVKQNNDVYLEKRIISNQVFL